MSRRRVARKRKVLPDVRHNRTEVSKFINCIMIDGKRSVAERIVYGAFDMIKERTGQDPIEVFDSAVENVRPQIEVRSRRVGGATYQVPMEVRSDRSLALAIRWLINSSRARSEREMRARLCQEFLDASNKRGNAVKKREDTHRMADANRAFSHFRW